MPSSTDRYGVRRLSAVLAVGALASTTLFLGAAPATAADEYSITFEDQVVGERPADWSPLWLDSDWQVEDKPPRLVHTATTQGRQGLSPDEVGEVSGDVEVSALVRPHELTGTQQVLFLHASGEAGSENAYYVDFRLESYGPRFRINRYLDGEYTTLERSEAPETDPVAGEWYQIVFQRSGDALRLKVWPYGAEEPEEWTVETTDANHSSGRIGFGHTTGGNTVTEWGHLGVSMVGQAPRVPDGVIPEPEIPDAPELENRTADLMASIGWSPDDNASYYEVERDGELVASPWQITGYADTVLENGDTGVYRVRGVSAVQGAGPWSEPISVEAPATRFPSFPTPFETDSASNTTLPEEEQFLTDLEGASDRIAVDTVGESVQGRDLRLVRVGYPTAPTEAEIASKPTLMINCTVHGNEWTPREACLNFLRDLALTEDPETLRMLSDYAVVVNPTVNPDGRQAGTRENANGVDLNRDYLALEEPETRSVVETINHLNPVMVLDGHNCCNDSIVPDWGRHVGVDDELNARGQHIVDEGFIDNGEAIGFTARRSALATGNLPVVARNYVGLRNSVGLLNEVRGGAIDGRLEEATGAPNREQAIRERAVRAFEFVLYETLQYFDEYNDDIVTETALAVADASSDASSYFFGNEEEDVLEEEVCGYAITDSQLSEIDDVLDLHQIEVSTVFGDPVLSLAQPSGRLIPLLLDQRSDYALAEGDALVGDACAEPAPVMEIDASADTDVASPGDTVRFSTTVTNTGPSDHEGEEPLLVLDLSRVLDAAQFTSEVSADREGTVTGDEDTYIWTGRLAAGESVTLSYAVEVAADSSAADELRSLACVADDDSVCATAVVSIMEDSTDPGTGDGDGSDDSDTLPDTGTPLPMIALLLAAALALVGVALRVRRTTWNKE
ncbi:M14 family zinc carboxypeptidase [uncultured Agrococcus sp.]|uniref:M14 family zinc carboxypeptidase n=1 Tax=uncultured Agrococcus sp. TaxID=382258 RepID=UPI0025EA0E5F|nr:M14 family zinc carboxypeptidase [uncultured Agrococcus sp.]